MLIRITEKCTMDCTHCLVDATPDKNHMNIDIFIKTIDFCKKINDKLLLITGGEPLEHPEFFKIINIIRKNNLGFIVLSNGLFLSNSNIVSKIIDLKIPFQITNDDRFYPKRINKIKNDSLFIYEDRIEGVSPFGRALTNKIECDRKYPMCFNIRSVFNKMYDFVESIVYLRDKNFFCTPSINIDGSISLGETNSCNIIGTINDEKNELNNGMKNFKCNKCRLENNLTQIQKNALIYI